MINHDSFDYPFLYTSLSLSQIIPFYIHLPLPLPLPLPLIPIFICKCPPTFFSPSISSILSRLRSSSFRRVAKALLLRSGTIDKMVQCVVPQNALASCEEMRSTVSALDRRESLVCPKPRRAGNFFGQAFNDPIRPLRWQLSSHQAELCDSKAELLDIILAEGGCGLDQMPSPVASSPPYFCGSPPSRAANPLVHDAHFGKAKLHSAFPLPIPSGLPSSPSASASASASASPLMGYTRATFGLKPAAVRIEGFNCLERDRQNRSISAMA